MNDTIKEILTEAFNRIQDEHGLALEMVRFTHVDTSALMRDCRAVRDINIDAIVVDKEKSK